MTYLRAQVASDLKVGNSISFATQYGNGQLSLGYKSAITVEISSTLRPLHINITVVVDSAVDKHFIQAIYGNSWILSMSKNRTNAWQMKTLANE